MNKRVFLLTALALSSCVYPFSVDTEDQLQENALVIDANILLGNTSTVTLSYLQPLKVGQRASSYGTPQGIVLLEDDKGNTYPAENDFGVYRIPSFPVNDHVRYRLTVLVEDKTYRSEWIEPTDPPEITGISFAASETQVIVQLSIRDHGEGSGYASATFEEIWKFHADFMRQYEYDSQTNSVFMLMMPDESHYWCWNKIVNGYLYNIDYTSLNGEVDSFPVYKFLRTSNRNHEEYNIRVKVWNLTPEQYRYRKMLEDNASIGGNLFSPEPGEVRGNVFCETDTSVKVYGYVNVSRVNVKDAVLDSRYNRWVAPKTLVEVDPSEYLDYSERGYAPVELMISSEGGDTVGWGLGRCYDCTLAGGTLEKPSFD